MRYFITGATGFIGRHLIKQLSTNSEKITALLHSNKKLEFGENVRAVEADITSTSDLATLMAGHDIVIHLAYGSRGTPAEQYHVTVEGTKCILNAAVQAGVRRFVHMSTISVYGDPPESITYDENSPRISSSNPYCQAKQDAESFVLTAPTQSTEVVVLQPGIIYGPEGGYWTQGMLKLLSQKTFPLLNEGDGLANLIYVHDVVDAILKATVVQGVNRECFILTHDKAVTWAQLFGAYEKIVGEKCLIHISAKFMQDRIYYMEKSGDSSQYRLLDIIYKLLFRVIQLPYFGKTLHLLEKSRIDFFTAKPVYSNLKARSKLGFIPSVDFETGIQKIWDWQRSQQFSL